MEKEIELMQENNILYEELKETKQLLETRTEEMQEEFFRILGNIKLFLDNGKNETAKQYVAQEYFILKNDLFDNNHDDE